MFLALYMGFGTSVQAHEGMWLPMLIKRLNYEDMKANGLQLTAEELYSINNSSLKDAIVSLGGFCTGEIISSQGLLLTNHHCGFDAIQSHSSEESNYLKDGFWAMSKEEEKTNPGLFVKFLVRMDDVTEQVMAEITPEMSETERQRAAAMIGRKLAGEATEGTHYDAQVKSFFHHNEYYLFVYETFTDVRLVGAPPSSIGKFGGDTDNWMWPRQTGDFSMFRVYSGPDGMPAEYSEENIPLKPKHHLPVSTDGVKEGDFTMIFGYPGSTDRYLSSYGVDQAVNKYNPSVVEIREVKLAIMREYMQADDAVDIQLASKYASTANYWKYYIGQTEQLKRNGVLAKKQALEGDFTTWVNQDAMRVDKYGNTLTLLEEAYKMTDPTVVGSVYLLEAGLIGPQIPLFAWRAGARADAILAYDDKIEAQLDTVKERDEKKKIKAEYETKREEMIEGLRAYGDDFFKDFHAPTDQKLVAVLWRQYAEKVPADQLPSFFAEIVEEQAEDEGEDAFAEYAEELFEDSYFTSPKRFAKLLKKIKKKKLDKDPAYIAGNELIAMYRAQGSANAVATENMEKGYRLLTAGLREMDTNKKFYPDANSTMRMTWGNVGGYDSNKEEGVHFDFYTIGSQILEKEKPGDKEFDVPEKLHTLIANNDFGDYAMENGELPVCFISNNDITGGNSGSPVINGRGELIGCAFDGNWEAMSGDIAFETQMQRTISVDIRYVLFVVDKYAGATHLVEEMDLVSHKGEESTPMEVPAEKEIQEVETAE